MMIIKSISFVNDKQQRYASCQGPPTVMMVLKSFGIKISFSQLYKQMNYRKGRWFFETYIVELLHSYGISSKYYSDSQLKLIGTDIEEFKRISGLDFTFYNRNAFDIKHYDSSVAFVLNTGLFQKRKIDMDFILSQVKKGRLVIATVNRSKLTGENGYKAHFILIKGFDNKGIICNDSYLGENVIIPLSRFKESFYCMESDKKIHNIVAICTESSNLSS